MTKSSKSTAPKVKNGPSNPGIKITSVNQKLLNAIRRDRTEVDKLLNSLVSDRAKRFCKDKSLTAKYEKEARVRREALELFERYQGKAQYSQCVHAVRTDFQTHLAQKVQAFKG